MVGLYLFHQSGNRYKGDYVDGIKEGQGIFWWTSGPHAGERYEGEFRHDRRNGVGVYWFANGDVFEGHWINGKRHGQGQMMFESDGNILNGTWFEGLRNDQTGRASISTDISYGTIQASVSNPPKKKNHFINTPQCVQSKFNFVNFESREHLFTNTFTK